MPTLTSHHVDDDDYHYDNDNCDVVFLRVNNYNGTHLGSGFVNVFKVNHEVHVF
jgi:hypothetical protein